MTSKVAEIFESLDYGPAPESAAPVLSWLDAHDRTMKLYINGQWVEPEAGEYFDTANPATGKPLAKIAQAGKPEVDAAVKAARKAFGTFSQTSKEERIALLKRILDAYKARYDDIAKAISSEMGAPITLATRAQAAIGVAHLNQMIAVLKDYEFEHTAGPTLIAREPIGVCGFITPWNWPINQIVCKVAPAIAAVARGYHPV